MQQRGRRRPGWRWGLAAALAVLPLAAGAGLSVAARRGALADAPTAVSLTALPHDWWLAAGALPTALALLALALVAQRDARAASRARAQEARRGAADAEGRRLLLSRLDHELKNPLTAMRAAVANLTGEAAAAGVDRPPGEAAALRSIEEQAVRLSRLTGDLRKVADVRSGPLERAPVDLAGLLQDAVTVVAAPGRAPVHLDLPRAPWPLPPVPGDQDLMELAVINLLENAVKYTPPDGTVEVRAREAGGGVVVEVADTGPGIRPEDLPHVWEELYRGASTRSVPGSGLGLPLVRAVAERHGGTATAESRVGRETVVRLELPTTDAPG